MDQSNTPEGNSSQINPNDLMKLKEEWSEFKEQFENVQVHVDKAVEHELRWPKRFAGFLGVSVVAIFAFMLVTLPDYTVGVLLSRMSDLNSKIQAIVTDVRSANDEFSSVTEMIADARNSSAEFRTIAGELADELNSIEQEIEDLRTLDSVEAAKHLSLMQDIQTLLKDDEDLRDALLQLAQDTVPLGAILPYYGAGDDPPRGYVWANGRARWPSEDWVPEHLRGEPVPDMTGRMTRGVPEESFVGLPGGDFRIPAHHTANDGDHSHELPPFTGSVHHGGSDPGGHHYHARDDHQGWGDHVHLRVDGGGRGREGQHRHTLGGRTIGSANHRHQIPAQEYTPAHVNARFIIRMK